MFRKLSKKHLAAIGFVGALAITGVSVARELIRTGRTEKPVTGFKGRSGKSFRARLALQQTEDGKWRVEFDEPWAREGAKPPEAEETEAAASEAAPEQEQPAAA